MEVIIETIVLILVLIGAFSALKAMSKADRSIVATGTANVIKMVSAYLFTMGKDISKVSYDSGAMVGEEINNSYQDELQVVNKFNTDLGKLGAAKTGISKAKEHQDIIGLTELSAWVKPKQ